MQMVFHCTRMAAGDQQVRCINPIYRTIKGKVDLEFLALGAFTLIILSTLVSNNRWVMVSVLDFNAVLDTGIVMLGTEVLPRRKRKSRAM
jgi:hypothetical protein